MFQCDKGPNEFAERIASAIGDEFESFAEEAHGLILAEFEIEDSQGAIELFVVVFGDAIFLNAELNVLVMELEVRFDHPMVTIVAAPLENERVRPRPPLSFGMQMTFSAANRFIDESDSP